MLQYKKTFPEDPLMPVRILLMDIDDTLFDFQTCFKLSLCVAFV